MVIVVVVVVVAVATAFGHATVAHRSCVKVRVLIMKGST
jgi:hypothetical protein